MQHCNSGTLHDKEFTTLNHCVDTIDDCCAGSELGEAEGRMDMDGGGGGGVMRCSHL